MTASGSCRRFDMHTCKRSAKIPVTRSRHYIPLTGLVRRAGNMMTVPRAVTGLCEGQMAKPRLVCVIMRFLLYKSSCLSYGHWWESCGDYKIVAWEIQYWWVTAECMVTQSTCSVGTSIILALTLLRSMLLRDGNCWNQIINGCRAGQERRRIK